MLDTHYSLLSGGMDGLAGKRVGRLEHHLHRG